MPLSRYISSFPVITLSISSHIPRILPVLLRSFFRIILPILLLFFCVSISSARTVRVGVYSNAPLVYKDDQGDFRGLTIDILRYIASRENWQLEFIEGSWHECLERLEQGELDIQAAIAYSAEREKLYHFNNKTVISNWARVYSSKHTTIDSLLDLSNKSVVLLENDIHARYFLDLIKRFDLTISYITVESYEKMLELVKNEDVDAALLNRLFAMKISSNPLIEKTPIIFNPIEIRYAAPKGRQSEIITAIDKHLTQLKNDHNSIYYQILETITTQEEVMPGWVKPSLFIAALLLLVSLVSAFILKIQVRRKTKVLVKQNVILTSLKNKLEEEMRHRIANEHKLRESEKRYATFFTDNHSMMFLIDPVDGRIVEANKAAIDFYGYSDEALKGMTVFEINTADPDEVRREIIQAGKGERNHFYFRHKLASGEFRDVEVYSGTIAIDGRELLFSNVYDISELKSLRGIIPICASCKQIRDDKGYWRRLEIYVEQHSMAEFSHGICPDCMAELYPGMDDLIEE